jgi:hypothetical protein
MSDQLEERYSSGDCKGWIGSPSDYTYDPKDYVTDESHKEQEYMLYRGVRKRYDRDIAYYPQQIGDCVGFGGKNAVEYLLALHTLLEYRRVFVPFIYGISRTKVGKNQVKGDGSLGSWMAETVVRYGFIFADTDGVPTYSAKTATLWGDSDTTSDLDKYLEVAKKFRVKKTEKVHNWNQLLDSLSKGYPVTTASSFGYSGGVDSQGFHRQNTVWHHQMCVIGASDKLQYVVIQNSMSSQPTDLKEFDSDERLPLGSLRIRRTDFEKHLKHGENYSFQGVDIRLL